MNIEKELEEIRIACKIADWFSVEQHVDYDFDLSLGVLFAEGRIVFYSGDILEFTKSIIPGRYRYRYQHMKADGSLIFLDTIIYLIILKFPHFRITSTIRIRLLKADLQI